MSFIPGAFPKAKKEDHRVGLIKIISILIVIISIISGSLILVNHQYLFTKSVQLEKRETGIIIPLYFDPNTSWNEVINLSKEFSNIPMIVIINPDNGSGSNYSATYSYWVKQLKSSNIKVIGYIFTSYGGRPVESVIKQALDYKEWYGLEGIFLDEVSDNSSSSTYYKDLVDVIRDVGISFIVGNPGTMVSYSIASCFNLTVMYEDAGIPNVSTISQIESVVPKSNLAEISYNVSNLPINWLENEKENFSYLYITNLGSQNPYYSLPSYLSEELDILSN